MNPCGLLIDISPSLFPFFTARVGLLYRRGTKIGFSVLVGYFLQALTPSV